MIENGVVYIATGDVYNKEAVKSAATLKNVMPNVCVALFSEKDCNNELFDLTFKIENPTFGFIDKISPLLRSPFRKTIFLNTDTTILDDISELFTMLEKYDFMAVPAPIRNWDDIVEIPWAFMEPNTGVLAFKKNQITIELIEQWLAFYKSQLNSDNPPHHDQSSLRYVLYKNDKIQYYNLGEEYNFRTVFNALIPGRSKIKIVHNRNHNPTYDSIFLKAEHSPQIFKK